MANKKANYIVKTNELKICGYSETFICGLCGTYILKRSAIKKHMARGCKKFEVNSTKK